MGGAKFRCTPFAAPSRMAPKGKDHFHTTVRLPTLHPSSYDTGTFLMLHYNAGWDFPLMYEQLT